MMIAALCVVALLGIVASRRSYQLAYRGIHLRDDTMPPWHAQPVHFAWWALGRTVGIALLIWLVWMLCRQPLIEYYLLHMMPIGERADNLFFLSDMRDYVYNGSALPRSLSDGAVAWIERYRLLLSTGNLIVSGALLFWSVYGLVSSVRRVAPDVYARTIVERWVMRAITGAAVVSVVITILIFASVVIEAFIFFSRVPVQDFLFGLQWSPQTALREDQAGASGLFGIVPLFVGTLLITAIALAVAVPIGLLSAVYISEYASKRMRTVAKPMLEVLAGIPTVVYGFFAITVIAPGLRDLGIWLDVGVASESAMAAGLVMGIMIIPLVSSLSDDAIKAVPQALRDASYGMGATQSETIKQVVLPAALPGIIGGVLLATSRAIGETMIVVMAAGLSANLTANPLESVTTITVQIVSLLVGDQEFGSTKTLAAFALGLTLFLFTLMLNIVALITVRRYRQAYE